MADPLFDKFISDLKSIEQRDSQLTSEQQITRLLRPGSTYFNLNPFEVLQVDPDTPIEDIKKQYRKMSILVHPDKNPNDKERAQQAFDVLKKAMEMLESELKVLECKNIIDEAKARTDLAVLEKRKQMKKAGKTPVVEEDDPEKYKRAVWVLTMKLFADREKKRKQLEARDTEDKKRKREEDDEAAEKKRVDEEFQKNFEESREERVASWKSFQTKADKRGKFRKGGFRPPKPKPESR